MKIPFDYQLSNLLEFKQKEIKRLAAFWQMRLGKSPLAIWFLQNQKIKPKRVLILCPKSVITSWEEELKDFNIPYMLLLSANKELHETSGHFPMWFIANYEVCSAKDSKIIKLGWDAIIADESTKIKNFRSNISRCLQDENNFPLSNLNQKVQYRVILAANPTPETELEYFPQFKFLTNTAVGETLVENQETSAGTFYGYKDFWRFRKDCFFTDAESPGKYFLNKEHEAKIGRWLSENNTYFLTRRAVGKELQAVYEKRFIDLPPDYRKKYDDFESNWFTEFMDSLVLEGLHGQSPAQLATKFATVAQNYLHQMACGFPKNVTEEGYSKHKLNELLDLIKYDLKGEKVVIWCQYLKDIEVIKASLKKLYYDGSRDFADVADVSGKTTPEQLGNILRQFRDTESKGRVDYLVCQIRKASMGMDFSAADTQIFFSRSWSALDNQQAMERLVHPEKADREDFTNILTIDLIAANTVDEDLYRALIEKKGKGNFFRLFLKRTGYKYNAKRSNIQMA